MRTLFCTLCAVAVTSTASAQVVISGDLTSGLPSIGNITPSPGDADGIDLADAPHWDFWTFSANAGDAINIEVDRLLGGLDPVSSVVFGNAGGLAFGSLTGTSIFDWSGPGLSANIAQGDDDDPPALPGPFGDPNYGFVAASTGVYTVAVGSFLSTLPFPPTGYPYSIVVTGSTVPAPGALALLGVAGLVVGGRRRRA
jgi:hypothetical protein